MVAAAVVLWRWLPDSPPQLKISYRTQLTAVAHVARREPILRWRAAVGFCAFAAFTCFWTTVTFLLAGHYHYNQLQIGLFALLGVGGAFTAVAAGRFLDHAPACAGPPPSPSPPSCWPRSGPLSGRH